MKSKNSKLKIEATGTEKFFFSIFLFFTLLIATGIILINYNAQCLYNIDMYSDILAAKEMWTEKTIFPDTWVFGNQFYIAATPVVSALMYGILGDSFLAMATASSLMMVLVLLSFVYCLKEAVDKKYLTLGLFCIIGGTILCAGAGTDVRAWQILYTMASYYSFYFIGVLLNLGVWLRLKKYGKVTPMIFVALILNFALGMNSLRHTLNGCLPLIALDFMLVLNELIKTKKLKTAFVANVKNIVFDIAVIVTNIAGVIAVKFFDIKSDPIIEEAKLTYLPSELFRNIIDTAKDVAAIMGFSLYKEGAKGIPLLIIATAFAAVGAACVIMIVKNKEETPLTYLIAFCAICLTAVAVTGVFILRTRHIYFYMWYLMLACCILYFAQKLKGKHKAIFLTAILIFGIVNGSYAFHADLNKIRERREDTEYMTEDLYDSGVEYIFSSTQFSPRIAATSHDKIKHGFVFPDLKQETGYATYPVWYIQSPEIFEHEGDKSAVFAVTSEQWEALEEIATEDYIELIKSDLVLFKQYETVEGPTYYFYTMTDDIISDFGVKTSEEKPYIINF